jgi:hypothetical protein
MLPRSSGSSLRSSSGSNGLPVTAAGKAWVKMMYRRVLSARARTRVKTRRGSGRGVQQTYSYPPWSRMHNTVERGVFAPLALPSTQRAAFSFLPSVPRPMLDPYLHSDPVLLPVPGPSPTSESSPTEALNLYI